MSPDCAPPPTSASGAPRSSRRAQGAPSLRRVKLAAKSVVLGTLVGLGAVAIGHAARRSAGAAGRRTSSSAATSGCRTGEVLALLDGLRGQNILSVDLDELADAAARARRGSRRARCAASCRRTFDVVVRERRPMGIGRARQRALPGRSSTAWSSTSTARPTHDLDLPVIDGLAVAAAARHAAGRRAAARALVAAPDRRRRRRSAGLARVSQIDVRDAHDAVVMLDGDTVMLRLGDATSPRGCRATWTRRRRSGSAWRPSTPWICGLANGCTCGRSAARSAEPASRDDGVGARTGGSRVARNERYIVGPRHRHVEGLHRGRRDRRRRRPRRRSASAWPSRRG